MKFKTVNGLVVVVTGASSGFGKGVALALAKEGAKLVLAARRDNLLDELAAECRGLGGDALAFPTDVSDPDEVKDLYNAALKRFGRIDVWINNAGVGAIGPFDEVPLEDHVKVIETDLLGTMYGSYQAWKLFRMQKAGTIINVSSVIGKIPPPYYGSYTAAKFGIVGLSGSLRREAEELKLHDVDVCTVFPMANDTPFFEHAANYTGRKSVPIPPLYDPKDVIEAIVNLITEPKGEVIVGTMGNAFAAMHGMIPSLVEKIMAKNTDTEQMERAPQAPVTSGNLREPVDKGSGVYGGLSGS